MGGDFKYQVSTKVYQSVLVYQSALRCTKVYQNVLGCSRAYYGAPKNTRAHQGAPECTRVYKSVPEFTSGHNLANFEAITSGFCMVIDINNTYGIYFHAKSQVNAYTAQEFCFVLFELLIFLTFLLGFWYGKCIFEKGSVSKTPQGGVQKMGGEFKYQCLFYFLGGRGVQNNLGIIFLLPILGRLPFL